MLRPNPAFLRTLHASLPCVAYNSIFMCTIRRNLRRDPCSPLQCLWKLLSWLGVDLFQEIVSHPSTPCLREARDWLVTLGYSGQFAITTVGYGFKGHHNSITSRSLLFFGLTKVRSFSGIRPARKPVKPRRPRRPGELNFQLSVRY